MNRGQVTSSLWTFISIITKGGKLAELLLGPSQRIVTISVSFGSVCPPGPDLAGLVGTWASESG